MTVIYTRISSPNQSSFQGNYVSIDNQLNECTKYCEVNKLTVTKHISEIVSGKDINKQTLLMSIFNYNNIDVIFYNVSRFSRNTQQAIKFVNDCNSKNIRLHFVEENISGNHHMDLHRLRLSLSHSEFESNTISHRIKSNNRILKAKGWKFGKPRYGEKVQFSNGVRKFLKNKYESELIKFIVMAKDGVTTCKNLNKQLKKIKPNIDSPIVFIDFEKDIEIEKFDKPNTLSYHDIADLLNSYDIQIRGKKCSASSISNIYNMCKKDISFGLGNLKISIKN